jgi:thiol-disulfide isomerase/thioredoxin
VAALDGAEWISLQWHLMERNVISRGRFSQVGSMTVVTGTNGKERVVGIQAPSQNEETTTIKLNEDTHIYKSSMATIPPSVSDQTAISTVLGALVGVHCVLPKLQHLGGSDDGDDSFVSGKVVVVGKSDYACFAARALDTLGAQVVQVATGAIQAARPPGGIEYMSPAVGELELGFCQVIGTFDALLDTISDEAKLERVIVREDDSSATLATSGVVAELRKQHDCQVYVSTMSHAQRIVRDEGVLWGPNKAKAHLVTVAKEISQAQAIVPPPDFSTTLQTLLDNGVVWNQKRESNNLLMRGWSLGDFWELTSWPRDSAGAGDTRYGLPVLQDVDTIFQERMVAEPPSVGQGAKFQEQERKARAQQVKADAENPHVMTIHGVDGLQRDVIAAEKDCLLFLSAPWCRTCRYLSPQYTRMARERSHEVVFAKADASGNVGKALGKALEVDAVPAFILFRQGQIFGTPLSVSRLPSRKLELAIDCLASGMEWDSSLLDADNQ